jgi:hypothetical protein
MVNRYTKLADTKEDIANVKEIDRLKTYLVTLPGVDKVITWRLFSQTGRLPLFASGAPKFWNLSKIDTLTCLCYGL